MPQRSPSHYTSYFGLEPCTGSLKLGPWLLQSDQALTLYSSLGASFELLILKTLGKCKGTAYGSLDNLVWVSMI